MNLRVTRRPDKERKAACEKEQTKYESRRRPRKRGEDKGLSFPTLTPPCFTDHVRLEGLPCYHWVPVSGDVQR